MLPFQKNKGTPVGSSTPDIEMSMKTTSNPVPIIPTNVPNISLNSDPPQASNSVFPWFAAATGIMVQTGVVLWHGFLTSSKNHVKFPVQTESETFALPLVTIGVGLLTLGMIMCSYVIDESTKETIWDISDSTDKFWIIWIQRGQRVNDQIFKSYVLFARGERSCFVTSHPIIDTPEEDNLKGIASSSNENFSADGLILH